MISEREDSTQVNFWPILFQFSSTLSSIHKPQSSWVIFTQNKLGLKFFITFHLNWTLFHLTKINLAVQWTICSFISPKQITKNPPTIFIQEPLEKKNQKKKNIQINELHKNKKCIFVLTPVIHQTYTMLLSVEKPHSSNLDSFPLNFMTKNNYSNFNS